MSDKDKSRNEFLTELDGLRQEIRKLRENETSLLWAKEQAELLYQLSPCAIFTVNRDRTITSWNRKVEDITGYTYEEIHGKTCSLICTEPCQLFQEDIPKPLLNKECHLQTKDGRFLIISKSADLLRDPENNIIGGIEYFEDITERVNMHNMLRSERDKFQNMITAIGQGLHIVNKDYEIEYENEVLKETFGDMIGRKCYSVFNNRRSPCRKCLMQSVLQSNESQHANITLKDRHYRQSCAPFQDVDGERKCLVLLRDITDELINQAKTMRTAQLASIGELAAGVAHEINNPVNGILNYAQLMKDAEQTGEPETLKLLIDRLINEGERLAAIVSKLLDFSRQHDDDRDVNREKTDIRTVLDDAFALFRHEYRKNGIKTDFRIADTIPLLHIHPHQLQQVFVNLFSNADYALNQRYNSYHDDKILKVSAEMVYENGRDFVRIIFHDHGIGIPEDIIDQVMNPFFTTKAEGLGTGLGLSVSRELVTSFGGSLHVQSREGEYTRIIIDLPLLSPEEGK